MRLAGMLIEAMFREPRKRHESPDQGYRKTLASLPRLRRIPKVERGGRISARESVLAHTFCASHIDNLLHAHCRHYARTRIQPEFQREAPGRR
jgi:5'-deoxynucleotidase YfbR-like HD superfamily hydrolase